MRADREGKVAKFLREADPKFIEACKYVDIPPTRRQASKWLAKTGLAWKKGRS